MVVSSCLRLAACAQPAGLGNVSPPAGATVPAAAHSWLEISPAAFEANVRLLRTKLSPHTQLCAVLKADAYGHGVALLAPSVIALGISWVGIASNEEARLLREAGYRKHIVRIRLPLPEEVEQGVAHGIEELVGNLPQATAVAEIAARRGKILAVHLALNSGGMSRHGLEMTTARGREDSLAVARLPGLKIVGIMTHFPVEEKADIERGLKAFEAESAWLIANARLDRKELILHCANSYTAHVVPAAQLDLVRCGSALYGDTAAYSAEYRPVMEFKSRVAALQSYPAGNTVSYDRKFVLKRASVLANIPVGYADGYRRAFSNKTSVLIRGKRCPVLGRVTMNSIVVDVTDHPEIQPGDEVVLYGRQGAAEIVESELEAGADTLWVELAIAWGANNPRVLKR